MPPILADRRYEGNVFSSKPQSNVISINVGGQIFQTTKQTLTLAGSKSILHQLTSGSTQPFLDRDPDLFAILLSLLRTGNLPSKAKSFGIRDIIEESRFYNLESFLVNSISNPTQFEAFGLEKSLTLPLNGRDSPSAIAATPFGILHVAHGSKITSFDWSLRRKSTILTQFTAVDSLLTISSNLAAAGATDFSGLQIIDLENGFVKETLNWENITNSGSTVQAVGSSRDLLFTSFESGRRNSNSIMVYDINTLMPVTEMAHNEIYGADLDSAIPASKLRWVSGLNLVMAAGSHSGPSGVFGNIKLWDIRTGQTVWELKEKVDCFADIAVSDNLSAMFKIGVNSAEVSWIDFRKLGEEGNGDAWNLLGGGGGDRKKKMNGKKEGYGCKIECHGNQVFCERAGEIEMWSEVVMNSDRVFRKNLMGRVKDKKAEGLLKITNMVFGGNKMFVTRKDQQSVEVWLSSE